MIAPRRVDVDHVPVVVALGGRERAEQHDAGIVDQYVRTAEFLLHVLGGGDELFTVGDVRLDRECARPKLSGEGRDPVGTSCEQCDPVPGGVKRAGCCGTDAGGGAGDDGDPRGGVLGHGLEGLSLWVRAEAYSSVVTCAAHSTAASCSDGGALLMARCSMKLSSAAPCQCHSPGGV